MCGAGVVRLCARTLFAHGPRPHCSCRPLSAAPASPIPEPRLRGSLPQGDGVRSQPARPLPPLSQPPPTSTATLRPAWRATPTRRDPAARGTCSHTGSGQSRHHTRRSAGGQTYFPSRLPPLTRHLALLFPRHPPALLLLLLRLVPAAVRLEAGLLGLLPLHLRASPRPAPTLDAVYTSPHENVLVCVAPGARDRSSEGRTSEGKGR